VVAYGYGWLFVKVGELTWYYSGSLEEIENRRTDPAKNLYDDEESVL
jgi:hypothetical protein